MSPSATLLNVTSGTRPGGRSARVREDVHQAVLEKLASPDWSRVNLGAVASAAGVNPATLYRRWGSVPELLSDVMATVLAETSPLPDTGTLAGDVRAYAAKIAADLASPDGRVLLRAAVLIGAEPAGITRHDALEARTTEVEAMLQRARDRGEPCGTALEFFECVTGPLYGFALFGPAGLQVRAPVLAERFLGLAPGAQPGT